MGGGGREPAREQAPAAPPPDPDLPELDDFRDIYLYCLQQEHPFDPDQLECILYEDVRRGVAGGLCAAHSGALRLGPAARALGTRAGSRRVAQGARDEALSRIYKTRSRMTEGSAEAKERLDRARAEAWRRAKRARSAIERGAREAKRRTNEIIDRYPVSVVALGIAAGAAIGSAMPETRAEDRLMGDASDSLKAQGKSVVREQATRVKQVAAAAREEAHAQGMDRYGVGAQGQALREKAGRVVDAARAESQHRG